MARFFLILLLFAPRVASAAIYHVDFAEGSDVNDGLTTQTPWQHCPGDTNARGLAADKILKAGDSVIFRGGVVYFGAVNLTKSGISGDPITFDGNSSGSWGTGKATFDFTNHPSINYAFMARASISNIIIKNFRFKDIGGYDVPPPPNGCESPIDTSKPGSGIVFFNYPCSDIKIQNCQFEELGEWHPQDPFSNAAIDGVGISLQNSKRILVSGCDFTKLATGISIKAANSGDSTVSDIEVTNCNFHNYIRWCIDIAPRSAGTIKQDVNIRNILIHDSQFHDYAEYDIGNWQGCGGRPHTDGIFIRRDFDYVSWSGLKIYGNQFYNTTTNGGGTACIYITEGPSVDVFNNVFINTLHGRTVYLAEGPWNGYAQTVRIYNNTFYNNHTAVSLTGSRHPLGFVSIKNNIFYDTRTGSGNNFAIFSEQTNQLPDELDYNLYYSRNTAAKLMILSEFGEMSLDQLRSKGYEPHGIQADPLFIDISPGLFPVPLANNLQLQPNSPAIGAGADLSHFFSFDKAGHPRSGSPWDLGAFVYSPESRPIPPSDLILNPPIK